MDQENLAEIKGFSIFYKDIGAPGKTDLPVLVFLHDALGSIEQWKDFPDLLAGRMNLRAIVFERRGYGRSSPLSEPRTRDYLHEEAREMLPAFLRKLGIKKPVLIGHSDGGTIALLYAARYKTTAIICEAAHVLVEEETLQGIRAAAEEKDFLIGKLTGYHGPEKAERLFSDWQETWLAPDFRDWNIEEDLKTIDCPALLIQGEMDEYATREHLEKIKKGIGANARSVLIKGSRHIPHLDAKEEVLEEMAGFLEKVL